MTGFRSGTSGSLKRKAKAAGRAIGKRRGRPPPVSSCPLSLIHPRSPPRFLSSNSQYTPPTPRRITAQEHPSLKSAPVRPNTDIVEMWKDYRAFKAAGMLAQWREKWAWYLAAPAA